MLLTAVANSTNSQSLNIHQKKTRLRDLISKAAGITSPKNSSIRFLTESFVSSERVRGHKISMNWVNFTEAVEIKEGLGLHGWPETVEKRSTAYMSKVDVDTLLQGFEGPNPTIYFYLLSAEEKNAKKESLERFRRGTVDTVHDHGGIVARKRKTVTESSKRNLKRSKADENLNSTQLETADSGTSSRTPQTSNICPQGELTVAPTAVPTIPQSFPSIAPITPIHANGEFIPSSTNADCSSLGTGHSSGITASFDMTGLLEGSSTFNISNGVGFEYSGLDGLIGDMNSGFSVTDLGLGMNDGNGEIINNYTDLFGPLSRSNEEVGMPAFTSGLGVPGGLNLFGDVV
jgi:hypothetical protein